jgi:hypothetical protein
MGFGLDECLLDNCLFTLTNIITLSNLSAKSVPTFADKGFRVVSATNPRCFLEIAPHLSSRGWVDLALDPLLLRKSGSVGNRSRDLWIYRQELWPLDHRGGRHQISHSKWLGECQSVCHATTVITKDVAQHAVGMEGTVLLIIKRTFDQAMKRYWTLRDSHRISKWIVAPSTADIHFSNECDQSKAYPSWRYWKRTTVHTLTDAPFAVYCLLQIVSLARLTKQGEHRCLEIVKILDA